MEPEQLSDYVMNLTHSFIHTLRTFQGVIGNHEEKLKKLIPLTQIPENIAIFLDYPREIAKGNLLFIHGHQLSWVESGPDAFHPLIENEMLTYRLFFMGITMIKDYSVCIRCMVRCFTMKFRFSWGDRYLWISMKNT